MSTGRTYYGYRLPSTRPQKCLADQHLSVWLQRRHVLSQRTSNPISNSHARVPAIASLSHFPPTLKCHPAISALWSISTAAHHSSSGASSSPHSGHINSHNKHTLNPPPDAPSLSSPPSTRTSNASVALLPKIHDSSTRTAHQAPS